MRTFRGFRWIIILLFAAPSGAQIHRPAAPVSDQPSADFGSKFFRDLKSLFGELQQSELARAFQSAKPIHCSELVSQKGEWKEVAFLNDDRALGDWHFENIEQVKKDLAAFIFSGPCFDDQTSVKVATSFPVRETFDRFLEGKLPFGQIIIVDNSPVSALFNRSTDAYTFQLPYLYLENKHSPTAGNLYTLSAPLTTSEPDRTVAEEFRCKALSGPELTYRFLLCRTRVINRDAQIQRQADQQRQPLGNEAYYILSDGKEAGSTVKLTFEHSVEAPPVETAPPDSRPASEKPWKTAAPQARLVEVGQDQFRLRFDPRSWSGRIDKPQLLIAKTLSDQASTAAPERNKEYCAWHPDSATQAIHLLDKADDSFLYTLGFKKELQSVSSATFDVEGFPGVHIGALQCFFPQSDTPATITAERFAAIVGDHITLEVRPQN